MNRLFTPFFGVALSIMLALTGQSMAMARGGAATGQMVICTGAGPITVYVDATGEPTSAPHICAECILVLSGSPTVGVSVPFQTITGAVFDTVQTGLHVSAGAHTGFLSRAPPVSA